MSSRPASSVPLPLPQPTPRTRLRVGAGSPDPAPGTDRRSPASPKEETCGRGLGHGRQTVPQRVPLPLLQPTPRARLRPSRISVIVLLLVVSLLAAEYVWLSGRQEAWVIARANERVEAKIETARAHLVAQHWDAAIRHLTDALAVERATNRDEARLLLDQAHRGQADALLEAAKLAIARRDSADALRLLRAYAVHPQATELARARLLRDELRRATDNEEAARLLARLSDDALALCAQQGQLTEDGEWHSEGIREIFKDTVNRRLPHELKRRQAKQDFERRTAERRAAERERQIARLRDTPIFRAVVTFAAQTRDTYREQQQLSQRQETELRQLFQQLGVKDPQEQAAIRADLTGGEGVAALRKSIERKRAEFKQAFRAALECKDGDGPLFDQLVDAELNPLLTMRPPS